MRRVAWVAACLALACGDAAEDAGEATEAVSQRVHVARIGALEVWGARAPEPAAGDVASLYFRVRNTGSEPDTLVGVTSSAADMVMLHRSTVEGGMARMTDAGVLVVEPGQELALEPGGLHAMLMGLVEPLAEGDTVEATIRFSVAGP